MFRGKIPDECIEKIPLPHRFQTNKTDFYPAIPWHSCCSLLLVRCHSNQARGLFHFLPSLIFFPPELSDHLFPQNKKKTTKNNPSKSAASEVRLRVTAAACSIHSANRRAANPQERMREDTRLYIRRQKIGREHKEPNSWTEQEQERRGRRRKTGEEKEGIMMKTMSGEMMRGADERDDDDADDDETKVAPFLEVEGEL